MRIIERDAFHREDGRRHCAPRARRRGRGRATRLRGHRPGRRRPHRSCRAVPRPRRADSAPTRCAASCARSRRRTTSCAIDFTEIDVEQDSADQRTVRLGGATRTRGARGRAKEIDVTIDVGVEPLTRAQLIAVARDFEPVALSDEVLERLDAPARRHRPARRQRPAIYGLSTGFGSLATTFISPEERRDLQRSLDPLARRGRRPRSRGRGRARDDGLAPHQSLQGVSGVRTSTAEAYAAMINASITPVVHEFGSLGCSGDLAPLAHVALALDGRG